MCRQADRVPISDGGSVNVDKTKKVLWRLRVGYIGLLLMLVVMTRKIMIVTEKDDGWGSWE